METETARDRLQAWLERTLPDAKLHTFMEHNPGYYATNDRDPDCAVLRYWGGTPRIVEQKLQEVAARLDERGTVYTWETGYNGFKYLRVQVYVWIAESDPAPADQPALLGVEDGVDPVEWIPVGLESFTPRKGSTMPQTHPRYSAEFRAEAIRLVRSSGKSKTAIAHDLGISLSASPSRHLPLGISLSASPWRRYAPGCGRPHWTRGSAMTDRQQTR